MIRLPLAAAVLVGGRSRRMGWDKAGLAVGGSPMLRRLVATLQPLFPEIWLVGTADSPLEDQAIRAVPDRQPGRGPLGGLQAALLATSAPAVFCLACDMPFANPVVIRYLCELRDGVQAVVPRTAAGYEPLHALYQRTCLPTIEASLAAGDVSLQRLLASLHIRAVAGTELERLDPGLRGFVNVNTPVELEAVLRLAAEVGSPGSGAPHD